MISGFKGRHSSTGTVVNALAAIGATDPKTGAPYSEALAFGASGGAAFGYFVFEYKGHPPHVALLTRNTFGPFERTLDNLAIRRESRETTDAARAEKNLRTELDSGNPVIVIADAYSLPYTGLDPENMWYMRPLLVVGMEGDDFLVADGPFDALRLTAAEMASARARVKKDRHRMILPEKPDVDRIPSGLRSGIETACALFLDKPPAGSPNNFGIVGMRHWAKMLTDKGAKGWIKTFEPGPRLVQALAGTHGQPGVGDWIERWGTDNSADRELYADFLIEANAWLDCDFSEQVTLFRQSAALWRELAEAALPESVQELGELRNLKRRYNALWLERGADSNAERAELRKEMASLEEAAGSSPALADAAPVIRQTMAEIVSRLADLEEPAFRTLRNAVGSQRI